MGTTRYYDGRGLYDHEGYVQFLDSATKEWSTTWGHEHLGSPDHDPIGVRAGCDCGWAGPELPWTAAADYPDEAAHEALMLAWSEHVDEVSGYRRRLEAADQLAVALNTLAVVKDRSWGESEIEKAAHHQYNEALFHWRAADKALRAVLEITDDDLAERILAMTPFVETEA